VSTAALVAVVFWAVVLSTAVPQVVRKTRARHDALRVPRAPVLPKPFE
jgi:hypothetical protein